MADDYFSFGVPDVSQAIQGATNAPPPVSDPAKIGSPDLSAMPSPNKPGSLYESFGVPTPPKFIRPPVVNAEQFIQKQQKALLPEKTKLENLANQLGEFEGEKAKVEADTKVKAAEGRVAASEKMLKDMELPELRQAIKDTADKMTKPFVPTAENAKDIATLFSLINVVGFAFGVSGKGHAQQAMSAMNGMLEGHQKGRDDLYKKEKDIFEENMKQLKTKYDALMTELKDSMEMAKTNYQAGLEKAELAATQLGADWIKQNIKKFGLSRTYDIAKESYSSMEKMIGKAYELEQSSMLKAIEEENTYNRLMWSYQVKMMENKEKQAQKLAGKIDQAIINELKNYSDIQPENLGFMPPKAQEQVKNSFQSIGNIEYIADFIAKKPDAVSVLAKAMANLNINAFSSLEEYEAQMSKVPLSEDASLLNKMLTTQAYRDVQATGQRPTVYLDRVFKGLYNQGVTPPTLLGILKQRQREANDILGGYQLNMENSAALPEMKLYNNDPRDFLAQYGPRPNGVREEAKFIGWTNEPEPRPIYQNPDGKKLVPAKPKERN